MRDARSALPKAQLPHVVGNIRHDVTVSMEKILFSPRLSVSVVNRIAPSRTPLSASTHITDNIPSTCDIHQSRFSPAPNLYPALFKNIPKSRLSNRESPNSFAFIHHEIVMEQNKGLKPVFPT